ncbi:MAG: ABC transporter permease [Rhodoferax sp.]|nr:ABC transporter permease [Rhodoferax sp.]
MTRSDGLGDWRGKTRVLLRGVGERPLAATGATILLLWACIALAAPWIAPYDPLALDFSGAINHAPSAKHWLGTDSLGRDLLSRIVFGARTLFAVVPLAVGSAFVVGIALGAIAAYSGGLIDQVVSRASDVMLAFPALIIYVILLTSLGPSLINIVIAVTLAYAPGVGRLARGQVLAIKELDYVKAAQARGDHPLSIIVFEILPNARGPLVVDLSLRAGYTVILTGTLGFLGLGLPPPTPDWGAMVVENTQLLSSHWHMAVVPCVAIVSVVVACNFLADGLRD